jgi:hypothetical protein
LRFAEACGQGRKCEAAVGEANPLGVVTEDLVRRLDDLAFMLRYGLPSGFRYAMQQNELMHVGHNRTVTVVVHTVNVGAWWRKLVEAVFDSLIIRVRHKSPRDKRESRHESPLRVRHQTPHLACVYSGFARP